MSDPYIHRFVGRVTYWHATRGYGYVKLDDGRTIFVHHSALKPKTSPLFTGYKNVLYSGETVELTVGTNPMDKTKICGLNVTGIHGSYLMCDVASYRVIQYKNVIQNELKKQQQFMDKVIHVLDAGESSHDDNDNESQEEDV